MPPLEPRPAAALSLVASAAAGAAATPFAAGAQSPSRAAPVAADNADAPSFGGPGTADADGPLWKDGAFRRDAWRHAGDGDDLGIGPVIVSKARWAAEHAALAARGAPIGLRLEGGMTLDDLADDLPRFSLIALNFPKFSDGRPFSLARLLREKYGFSGELRATGNVLSDQIPFMRRVGFDAFEVLHRPSRRQLQEGRIAEVRLYYQPVRGEPLAPGSRPWLRRSPD
jgi:uncharacterized protein (DUF934 family)